MSPMPPMPGRTQPDTATPPTPSLPQAPAVADSSGATTPNTATVTHSETKAGHEKLLPSLAAGLADPVARAATWQQVKALGLYMTKTEVHTYAFSVSAQVLLSMFPFILLLLTISRRVFHSASMENMVVEMMSNFMPKDEVQLQVMKTLTHLANGHASTKVFSIVMLFITVTGVFLPLEVALNSVWGVHKDRSYLQNQVVSIGLALGVAFLALFSVALSTAQRTVLGILFFGHTDNIVFAFIGRMFLQICALTASIGLFFIVYWGLPNRKVPAKAVLPTAIVMGVIWTIAKYIYIMALPYLDFRSVYGGFEVTITLIMWAFISGLLLLAGGYVSATRQALRETQEREAEDRAELLG